MSELPRTSTASRIAAMGRLAQATPSLILEHRARPAGGRLAVDATPDPLGWIGLRLTQNLDLKKTPVDRTGRPA
jgi:hypothetical protein